MVTNFGVFGSYACRDIFYSEINPDYKKYFNICSDGLKISLISLMSEKVSFNESSLKLYPENDDNLRNYNWIKRDLDKSFLRDLLNEDIEYLLIDTYHDVNQGVVDLGDGRYITNNDKLCETNFFKNLNNKFILNIQNNTEEYFTIWKKSCDKFFKFLKENCPNIKVILNPVRDVCKVLKEDGTIYVSSDFKENCKRNVYRNLLDDYIKSNYDVHVLNFDEENTFADENHKWGFYSFHYNNSYHENITSQLNQIIQKDNIKLVQDISEIKLSIIMPVFNSEDSLEESINSVLSQTFSNFELLCIDDCSSDNSLNILNDFSQKDSRIKISSMPTNSGSGACRNKGLKLAKGKYIAFLDSDDKLPDKNSYCIMLDKAEEYNVNMVCGNILFLRWNGLHDNNIYVKPLFETVLKKPNEYGVPWYFYRNIFKKEFLDKFNINFPDFRRGQDTVFFAKVLSNLDVYLHVNINSYLYNLVGWKNPYTNFEIFEGYLKSLYEVSKILIEGNNLDNVIYQSIDIITELSEFNPLVSSKKEFYKLKSIMDKILYLFLDYGLDDKFNELIESFNIILSSCNDDIFKDLNFNFKYTKESIIENSTKISVIIPFYNSEKYLETCVRSILLQSYQNFEIICINDNSIDSSFNIIKNLSLEDNRIKIIENEVNQGPGISRNKGLDRANGKYIFFLDSDDWVDLDTLSLLFKESEEKKLDLLMYKPLVFYENNQKWGHEEYYDMNFMNKYEGKIFKHTDLDSNMLFYIPNAPWNKLYLKSFLDEFYIRFPNQNLIHEDNPFFLEVFLKANKISLINKFLHNRRRRDGSIMTLTNERLFDNFKIMDLIINIFLEDSTLYNSYKKEVLNHIFSTLSVKYYSINQELRPKFYNKIKEFLDKLYNEYGLYYDCLELVEDKYFSKFKQISQENYKLKEASNIKVSIIVPVYNVEDYLEECLESLINQSLKEIEIICVNDGSTDNSLKILNKYKELDNRIKVISQDNQGLSASRNNGLSFATGEYVLFVDSDDWIDLNACEYLYNKSKSKNLDVAYFLIKNYDDESKEFYDEDYFNLASLPHSFDNTVFNHRDIKEYIFPLSVQVGQKFYKRSLIKDLKFIEGIFFEDNPYQWEVLLSAERISVFRKHFYFYRKRKGSITSNFDEKFFDTIKVINYVEGIFKKYNLDEFYKEQLMFKHVDYLRMWYELIEIEFKNTYWELMKNDFKKIEQNKSKHEFYLNNLNPKLKKFYLSTLNSHNFKELDNMLSSTSFESNIAEDLIITSRFPPSTDINGIISSKKALLNNKPIDVVQHDFDGDKDYKFNEIINKLIDNRIIIKNIGKEDSLNSISEFRKQGMLELEKLNKNYKTLTSCAWTIESHILALDYKLKHPEVKWIAEFSDPLMWDINNNLFIESNNAIYLNDDEYLTKINNEIDNLNNKLNSNFLFIKNTDTPHFLGEYLPYLFADVVKFTNVNQRDIMLSQFPYDIKDYVMGKSEIEPHPILDESYYHICESNYEIDSDYLNFAYFGWYRGKRPLEYLFYALESLKKDMKKKVKIHFFVKNPEFLKESLKNLDIYENCIINSAVSLFECLNLTTKMDILLVNDTTTKGRFKINPFLPSKTFDYLGSGSDIWAFCEKGSPTYNLDLTYKSDVDDFESSKIILKQIFNKKLNINGNIFNELTFEEYLDDRINYLKNLIQVISSSNNIKLKQNERDAKWQVEVLEQEKFKGDI